MCNKLIDLFYQPNIKMCNVLNVKLNSLIILNYIIVLEIIESFNEIQMDIF